ncbi:ATP-dependent DNA helicase UvrD [Ferrimonas balearica DSM 9799]|uniref:DNA 3'-5' helicase n=1 Tax=Ferrimonas balearica (strain DSM 9799 / CCM 4581 / KCTC 23876 / PAT) TaxID=550540 RepID=E1SQD7_FERBD|nr:DNA helicase II [Ferrimonas balearica]ADN77908.1 ATP-dependent DNA helicase UvrD [Ferrimonas balearica DSM 9799]MBW3141402.1 DNA helicase II [Ferrimonas balearica]MBW3166432.1 DNA helicase II [Ferrimonas balearica]MBY5982161.1 DNA helicase II [Ferrimonas balearica]MBY6108446.1 DNA helicase II [Ferrimonas balearica]
MTSRLQLDTLNDKQRAAVEAAPGAVLVLAGAGSGKTRVLTHRIAWLLEEQGESPYAILAVTFTNKAAAEMRHRIEDLVHGPVNRMWIGTFHGLAHRLLRAHYQEAGLPEGFQILDSDDQQRLVKRILKSLQLDEKRWSPRQAVGYINAKKDEGLRPQHIDAGYHPVEKTFLQIYQAYQEACDRAGLVDFAELLLRAHELWLKQPHLLRHYQQRFRHILVDEFQDTNAIQYAWIRMLASDGSHIMIVGDDDQSIYGWRGARVENLQKFLDDFPGAQTIRLEQNYRSTSTILSAANALIAHNAERMGKELWTEGATGEPISLYCAFNELEEARYIVGRIKQHLDGGGALSDCAILYRSNAQSRVLEEALLHQSVAYRIYGGLRFFERQEIKDALGYLRLIANRHDDAAFERIVNTPTRGIGDRTLDIVRATARAEGITLWRACQRLLSERGLAGRAASAVAAFISLIDQLEEEVMDAPLKRQADHVINHSGLRAMYEAEKGEKAEARIENLNELVTAAGSFERPEDSEEMSELNAFLAHAALEAGEGQADDNDDAVQLMTLHSAKGLEFPLVFMCGVEEGMFPSQMALDEGDRLEEERRLCYVGMTRAMQKLYITYAESRRLYGRETFAKASRFIREIPQEHLDEVRLTTQVSQPRQYNRFNQSEQRFNDTGFSLGQRVHHPKFGDGVIINYEGSGPQSRVQVAFDGMGVKWLVVAYARLEAR